MTQIKSQYSLVWNQLKSKRKCEIIADPRLHKRIIKAVSRKKELDLAYKLLNSEAGVRERIRNTIVGTKITFELIKTSVNIGDL